MRYKRGDRREYLQELSCARPVTRASSGHIGTLLFEGPAAVDMGVVCSQDVKKMLVNQARMVYWKKWAAKHEHEVLKEEVSNPSYAAKKDQRGVDRDAPKCVEETGR